MAVDFAVPTGDSSIQWSIPGGTHWDDIDEGIGGGSGGDYIEATNAASDDGDIDDFSFGDNINDVDEITQVIINVNSWSQPAVSIKSPEIDLYFGGQWMSVTVGWKEVGSTGTRGWHAITYAGLSGNQTDMDNLRVRVRADVAGKLELNYIYTINVEVTYSQAVAGWAHNFLGVPAANIGSVNGVPRANIGKIKGV